MLNSAEVRIRYDLSDAYEKLGAFAATLAGAAAPTAPAEKAYKVGDFGSAGGWVNLPRLKGQEGKPMIKEGRIMGERRVFTKAFKERAVEPARNTKRKRACPRPWH
jgi:hypothetical protein